MYLPGGMGLHPAQWAGAWAVQDFTGVWDPLQRTVRGHCPHGTTPRDGHGFPANFPFPWSSVAVTPLTLGKFPDRRYALRVDDSGTRISSMYARDEREGGSGLLGVATAIGCAAPLHVGLPVLAAYGVPWHVPPFVPFASNQVVCRPTLPSDDDAAGGGGADAARAGRRCPAM